MSKQNKKRRSKHQRKSNVEELVDNDGSKFEVRVSDIMGRYMVAKKSLKPGEIILTDEPLVIGPCTGARPQCLGCYHLLSPMTLTKCPQCQWPLCSSKCPGYHQKLGHSQLECDTLKSTPPLPIIENDASDDNFDKLSVYYQAITPLRCLLLKKNDNERFQIILKMENHNEIRRKIGDLWENNQKNVVERIRKDWGLEEYGEEEIHGICGVLEVNAFEVGQKGVSIRALYPTAFYMAHDCVPNTNHLDDETNYNLTVRASVPIQAGRPITLSYAYTLQGTVKRREQILENKFFECQCDRCRDPTELGTYLSSLICPKCQNGHVLSTNPLDNEADWCCDCDRSRKDGGTCPGYNLSAKAMRMLIKRIAQEADSLDCNDIEGMETFLEKYRNVLHPNHYLCLNIKLSLSQLYGKINGYLIHELSNELLLRKREICLDILKVFDILEPGMTRLRGVTLYELHAPLMILLTRQFSNGTMNKMELKLGLREVIRYLKEASEILGFELGTSPEGEMGLAAKDALDKMKDWEKILGRL